MVNWVHLPVVDQCWELVDAHENHEAEIGLQLSDCNLLPSSELLWAHHLARIQIGLVDDQLHYAHAEEEQEHFRYEAWNGSGWPSLLREWLDLHRRVGFSPLYSRLY